MPVATVRTFGSKMMSSGGKPTFSVSSLYERSQTSILRSKVSAWPVSSKAITTTAAPYLRINEACSRNCSSPSLRLIEFTIPLPCTHCKPISKTDHLELSIMMGTRAISDSAAIKFKKVSMASSESSMPSSMLTSIIWAPFSTCWRATESASSNLPSRIILANRGEPATLVRSPTLIKFDSGLTVSASSPLSRIRGSISGSCRGEIPSMDSLSNLM